MPVQLPTAPHLCVHPDETQHWVQIGEECQAPIVGASVKVWNWFDGYVLAVDYADEWVKVHMPEPADNISPVCWVTWGEIQA
jgi:hypothetical protein